MDSNNPTSPDPSRALRAPRHAGGEVRPGDVLAGRFVLHSFVGHGGTGTVFAALDQGVGQKVAIKLLHPELHDERTRERLRREVRASRGGHPNAVTVYDLHEADGHVFLSMELVEGRSLKEILESEKELDVVTAARIGQQTAAALAHLHTGGIVHRDVKPGNVLVDRDGNAKLCDMGLARPIEEGSTVTVTEMVVGTPAYMAPEQALGADLTPASDVYALGLTLFECLTGTVPMTSDTVVSTLTRRQRARPPDLRRLRPDIPRWLARLVRRMLEPKPADRPSTARVQKALETGRVWPKPRRRTIAAAAATTAAVALSAVLIPRFIEPETVQFRVEDGLVLGIDADGLTTWTGEMPPLSTTRVLQADLDGDGREELVVGGRTDTVPSGGSTTHPTAFVAAFDLQGRVVTRLAPEDFIGGWLFPYAVELSPVPFGFDLDADGLSEVVLLCKHTLFYPTVVIVYWPRWDRWETTIIHPGHLTVLAPGAASGRPGLRLAGVNNLLAFTPVYGEVELTPPGNRLDLGDKPAAISAPPLREIKTEALGRWTAYTPLDEATHGLVDASEPIVSQSDGSVSIGFDRSNATLDHFDNPVPGPNAGRDLRESRLDFMGSLYRLVAASPAVTQHGVQSIIDSTRSAAGPLMQEPSYRVILGVVGARALAVTGDPAKALEFLSQSTNGQPDEDVILLRGHLEAISGKLERARDTATQLVDEYAGARSHYDGLYLLLQIATALHDEPLVNSVLTLAGRNAHVNPTSRQFRAALAARARLWWDRPIPVDGALASGALAPEGEAIGCLARWRLDRVALSDIARMEMLVAHNPDTAGIGRVALAAAHLGHGDPEKALRVLDTAIAHLEQTAAFDFVDHESLGLARAFQALAYEANGELQRAGKTAASLATELAPDLLPGVIVREVSIRTNS